jgi:phytoene synthase
MSSELAEESIKTGSKSFSFAGMFFPREEWQSACAIYHWCRHCDDHIDDHHLPIEYLFTETRSVLNGGRPGSPPFRSLQTVFKRYNIPSFYAEELLRGMEMDTTGTKYETMKDLELYCYRVASTVGLMMCYIMGVFHLRALEHAAHLGMAMQLTNISRDVKEDQDMGRSYLPSELLNKENAIFDIQKILLQRAEGHYESGFKGLAYLPLRSAFVICMAALIYREIGRVILKNGPEKNHERAYVKKSTKIFLAFKAFFIVMKSLPERVMKRNKTIEISSLWIPA